MSKIIADAPCWRAELTIGTRHGYNGPEVVRPDDLIPHIEAHQRDTDPWFPVIVWTCGTVVGLSFPSETVIKVSMESNPLYTAATTEPQISSYATRLAERLAVAFHQVRIYVSVYAIRSMIVEVAQ